MLKRYTGYKRLLALAALSGGAAPVERTATGNPLTFLTDLAKPLKSLVANFLPVQTGSGDPSPENVRPITGWTGVNVWHAGKNLFDKNAKDTNKGYVQGRYLLNTGSTDSGGSWYISEYISVVGGSKLSITNPSGGSNPSVCFYDSEKQFVSGQKYNSNSVVKVTIPATAKYMRVSVNVNYADVFQIEVGENITEYEPFKPITETDISFPSPVYGGDHEAVSGAMTVEWYGIVKKWSEGTNASTASGYTRKSFAFPVPVRGVNGQYFAQQKCNMAKLEWSVDRKTHFYIDESTAYLWLPEDTDADQEIQFVSKLVTPQEIQLTPQQITAIKGNNTIWSDANGEMTAVYLEKG